MAKLLSPGTAKIIQYILYDYPPLVQQLQAMPLIEIGVVGVFLIVGFVGFRQYSTCRTAQYLGGHGKGNCASTGDADFLTHGLVGIDRG